MRQQTQKKKRSMARFFWFIPALFLGYLIYNPVSLYYIELDLYISEIKCYWIMLAVSVTLIGLSRVRFFFTDNFLMGFLYYCIPILVLSIMVFAEHHFYLTLSLVLVSVGAGIFLTSGALSSERLSFRVKAYSLARGLLMVFCISFLIPSMIAILKYDMGAVSYDNDSIMEIFAELFSASDEETKKFSRAEELESHPEIILSLEDSSWKGLSVKEKLAVLQFIGNIECMNLGIPDVPISSEKLDGVTTLGSYDPETGSIVIDLMHTDIDSPRECVETIAHEVRHRYQDIVVQSVDWDSSIADCAYFDEAREWKENMDNYTPRGEKYFSQPIEVDAREYSVSTVDFYFGDGSRP